MIDLVNQEIFERINRRLADVMAEDDVRGALIFSRNMKFYLSSKDNAALNNTPDMRDEYEKMLAMAQFVCLSAINERDIIALYETKILEALMIENYDAIAKVRGKLLSTPDFSERDVLRRKLREALTRNIERIGAQKITINDGKVEPTIGQWLRKYSGVVGATPVSSVQLNQFLSSDSDVTRLTPVDKTLLRKLISLFEYLKRSSQTPEGLEDPVVFRFDDQVKVLREGKFEDVKLPPRVEKIFNETMTVLGVTDQDRTTKQSTAEQLTDDRVYAQQIVEAYAGDPKQEKAIDKEYDALTKKFGNDVKGLRNEFMASVQRKNVSRVIALLQIFSEQNDLAKFMTEDEKLGPFLSALWQKRYSKEFFDEFKKRPDQPRYVRTFLQYVLEERLGLTPSDAARVGVHIGNIFVKAGKKSYNKLAYFDVKDKQFKWFEE